MCKPLIVASYDHYMRKVRHIELKFDPLLMSVCVRATTAFVQTLFQSSLHIDRLVLNPLDQG